VPFKKTGVFKIFTETLYTDSAAAEEILNYAARQKSMA